MIFVGGVMFLVNITFIGIVMVVNWRNSFVLIKGWLIVIRLYLRVFIYKRCLDVSNTICMLMCILFFLMVVC